MPGFLSHDGTNLWYEIVGAGTPVVFVHQFGGDHLTWDWQLPTFSEHYQCIIFAARGFFPSDVPPDVGSYGQSNSTKDLLALMQHLGVESAHLVGTSMGSFTSLDFALTHSQRVRSLALVGNSSGPRSPEEREAYRNNWIEPEMERRTTFGGNGAVAVLEQDPAYESFRKNLPDEWQAYCDRLVSQSSAGAVNILRTVHWDRRSLWDEEARLRQLPCPVLLVHGDEDYYLVGETNQFLDRIIPNANLRIFENTGHLVNIEQYDAFNSVLFEHLQSADQHHSRRTNI